MPLNLKKQVFLMLLAAWGVVGCQPGNRKPVLKPADPAWGQFLSQHTAGIVSRKTKISVRFSTDVFEKERIGQSAESFLSLDPAIPGPLVISDTREITLVPEKDLTPGAFYKARLHARGLSALPEKIGDYEFLFQVIQRAMDVRLEGVTVKGDEATVTGTLSTSDQEAPEDIEKTLFPKMGGAVPVATWVHDPDGKKHDFTITGVQRAPQAKTLTLAWNGGDFNIDGKGELPVEIPGTQDFKVIEFKPVTDAPRHVAVYFSDELDPKQNLKGLVRVNLKSFTLRVEGSVLKIFADSPTTGTITVTLEPGVRGKRGGVLTERREDTVAFASEKPQVRFPGHGVILPENDVLTVPIEAMNVNAVQVTAFQIYEDNIAQFLQTNRLTGAQDLGRVGRHLWRKTIPLTAPVPDQWQRYNLDVTSLMKQAPGGMIRLTLSINRSNSLFACAENENATTIEKEPDPKDHDDAVWGDPSGWDGIQSWYYDEAGNFQYRDREDPCKDTYYLLAGNTRDARNFLASNIGLLAKSDATGEVSVVATDLRTAEPINGVRLSVRNFQNQDIGQAVTDGDGFARIKPSGKPFYLLAENNGDRGYLKLSDGTSLPVSHFNTGGERTSQGLKGFIYGERGVWRPGDDIHLTFVLEDKNNIIPNDHPATLKLVNPRGQVVDTKTNARPVGDFYRFDVKTDENAPTGTWTADVALGGSSFTRALKIETVKPNRLKIDLDWGEKDIVEGPALSGVLSSQWLHGASAGGLKADVVLTLAPGATRFTRGDDHIFDDPTRTVKADRRTVFEGTLDPSGKANFTENIALDDAPGFLNADFKIRVFEAGGDFSVSHKSAVFSPFKKYTGLKLPKGDQTRNMLLTDQNHTVSLMSLSTAGEPLANTALQVTLYKSTWRWWWDQSGNNANYQQAEQNQQLSQGTVTTGKDGRATWSFMIKYPDWGRYLVRACDNTGGHCSAQYVYIDWPGWAGRAQEQSGPGANALYFFSDKSEYTVGEKAVLQLPDASEGRGLLTIENGSRLLEQRWIKFDKKKTKFEIPITAAMAPNVYACLTLVQPHADKKNDRPIRLYGIVPLKVTNPDTQLTPVIEAPDEWRPQKQVSVKVKEANGRPFTYTLAVVDEGLLGLTNHKTPDLHGHFYRKEALGVRTWDLYDDVVGAYGGVLERLLAIGGGDDLGSDDKTSEERRFPPVVLFMGPFSLDKGETHTKTLDLPQYVGQVRVMVVAGEKGAYGRSEKNVFIRDPLSLLPTLPRVVGPLEDITVPVSLFVMDKSVRSVNVSLDTDNRFDIVGPKTVAAAFSEPGDRLVFLKIKSSDRVGTGRVSVLAQGGGHETRADTALSVRAPNVASVKILSKLLEPGQEWSAEVKPHGLPGTNETRLEVSSLPPLNLENRLRYLIQYPHGCLEQTTSAVFPQLYLSGLVQLTDTMKTEIEKNIATGIDRLRLFQASSGGFYYWPGATNPGPNDWATNYAGHFLVEAERLGYSVPADMKAGWVKYQKDRAQAWAANATRSEKLEQAYRLYTLALSGNPALAAMNRLKETPVLGGTVEILLAAAYQAAGVAEAAQAVANAAKPETPIYSTDDPTFGSDTRDTAIYLASLAALKKWDEGKDLAQKLSDRLSAEQWMGTHETSYALLALSRFYERESAGQNARFERAVGTGAVSKVSMSKPIATEALNDLPDTGAPVRVKNNGDRRLFVSLVSRGVPKSGKETAAANGLELSVAPVDESGKAVDPVRLKQGMDFLVKVTLKNKTPVAIHNIAVTHMVAAGWEIQSPAWGAVGSATPGVDYRDVRDDRVLTYVNLPPGASATWEERFHAAYEGHYYLPGVSAEAMYDATKHARSTGQWVDVTRSAK